MLHGGHFRQPAGASWEKEKPAATQRWLQGGRVSMCLCVGDQGAVTFSQASWTFTAAAIINSVPTETSLDWAGQYPSLRG